VPGVTLCEGDCLLTAGDSWISRLIRWGTCSRYSHVATLCRSRRGDLLVYEVTSGTQRPDHHTGKPRVGVRAEPLDIWLNHQPKVWVCRPLPTLTDSELQRWRWWWQVAHDEAVGYDKAAAFMSRMLGERPPRKHKTFCSAGYVAALIAIGRLRGTTKAHEMHPRDVAALRCLSAPRQVKPVVGRPRLLGAAVLLPWLLLAGCNASPLTPRAVNVWGDHNTIRWDDSDVVSVEGVAADQTNTTDAVLDLPVGVLP
jgi:hypothetical protein